MSTWFHMERNSSQFPGIALESTGASAFQPSRTRHAEHSSRLTGLGPGAKCVETLLATRDAPSGFD